ncbi:Hypothetical protein, putative [Bodo saltans]|uniref:Uncharacterized protein n=1 Tax=Bodo saltans TaxID=75058 RepID=A0A0S4JST6_BODSA|nr:Hypothetical protein, putative [Bodo saltans]|eukprot:CUG93268.1 Hypothetical protein, putative [Bodo saltans]
MLRIHRTLCRAPKRVVATTVATPPSQLPSASGSKRASSTARDNNDQQQTAPTTTNPPSLHATGALPPTLTPAAVEGVAAPPISTAARSSSAGTHTAASATTLTIPVKLQQRLSQLQLRFSQHHQSSATTTPSILEKQIPRSFSEDFFAKSLPKPNKHHSSTNAQGEDPAHKTMLDLLLSNVLISAGGVRLQIAVPPTLAVMDNASFGSSSSGGRGGGGGNTPAEDEHILASFAFEQEVVFPNALHLVDTVSASMRAGGTADGDDLSRQFTSLLRGALESLPPVLDDPASTTHPSRKKEEVRPVCCQLRLLSTLARVGLQAYELHAVNSSSAIHHDQQRTKNLNEMNAKVQGALISMLNTIFHELLDTKRLYHVFRFHVLGTTALTQLFMTPLLALQYKLSSSSSSSPSPLQFPYAFLEACTRFLRSYRKSFLFDRSSIKSAGEASAWIDSMVVILRGYVNTVEVITQDLDGQTNNGIDCELSVSSLAACGISTATMVELSSGESAAATAAAKQCLLGFQSLLGAAEQVLTTMTATDVEDHVRTLLMREKHHQEESLGGSKEREDSAAAGTNETGGFAMDDKPMNSSDTNNSTNRIPAMSHDGNALFAKVRSRRSLFGTATAGHDANGGEDAATLDENHATMKDLLHQVATTTSAATVSAAVHNVLTASAGGGASKRFVRRGGPSSALETAIPSPTPSNTTTDGNSPLVKLFVEAPKTLIQGFQQLSTQRFPGGSKGQRQRLGGSLVHSVEVQGLLLSRGACRLWCIADKLSSSSSVLDAAAPTGESTKSGADEALSPSSSTSSAQLLGTLHHLATQLETFATVMLRSLAPQPTAHQAEGASATAKHVASIQYGKKVVTEQYAPQLAEGSGWLQGDASVRKMYNRCLHRQQTLIDIHRRHSLDHSDVLHGSEEKKLLLGAVRRYSTIGHGPDGRTLAVRNLTYQIRGGGGGGGGGNGHGRQQRLTLAMIQEDARTFLTQDNNNTFPEWLRFDVATVLLRVAHAAILHYNDDSGVTFFPPPAAEVDVGGAGVQLEGVEGDDAEAAHRRVAEERGAVESLLVQVLTFLFPENSSAAASVVLPAKALSHREVLNTLQFLQRELRQAKVKSQSATVPFSRSTSDTVGSLMARMTHVVGSYWAPAIAQELFHHATSASVGAAAAAGNHSTSPAASPIDASPSSNHLLADHMFSESHALMCLSVLCTTSQFPSTPLPSSSLPSIATKPIDEVANRLMHLQRYCGRVVSLAASMSKSRARHDAASAQPNASSSPAAQFAAASGGAVVVVDRHEQRNALAASTLDILSLVMPTAAAMGEGVMDDDVRSGVSMMDGGLLSQQSWLYDDMLNYRADVSSRRIAALPLLETRRRHRQLVFLLSPSSSAGGVRHLMRSGVGSLEPHPMFVDAQQQQQQQASIENDSNNVSDDNTSSSSSPRNSGGGSLSSLVPLFPCSHRDSVVVSTFTRSVEANGMMLRAAGREMMGSSPPYLNQVEVDVYSCYLLLSRATHDPWSMLDRAFQIEQRIRLTRLSASSSSSNLFVQARTEAFLHLFAMAQPQHITTPLIRSGTFAKLVLSIEDFLCPSPPVTLLGLMREGDRSLENSFPDNVRRLRAQFVSVKQVVLQLIEMEKNLTELFPSPATRPGEDDDSAELDGTSSLSLSSTPSERSKYHNLHITFIYSLIAATDLVSDCVRTMGFQKSLESSLRAMLNHSVVVCCQLVHRMVCGEGTMAAALQQKYGTLGHISMSNGVDGAITVAATAISCFFSVLLTSDARHGYLDAVSKQAVMTVLESAHAHVKKIVGRCQSNLDQLQQLQDGDDDGAATASSTAGGSGTAQQLSRLFIEFSMIAPRSVQLRCGFGRLENTSSSQDDGAKDKDKNNNIINRASHDNAIQPLIHRVFDSLQSMALTSTLVRQTPTPGRTVHAVLHHIQQELIHNVRKAVANIPKADQLHHLVPTDDRKKQPAGFFFVEDWELAYARPDLLKSFQWELKALQERIQSDLVNAERELEQLQVKLKSKQRPQDQQQQPSSHEADDSTTVAIEEPLHSATASSSSSSSSLTASVPTTGVVHADAVYLTLKVRTLKALSETSFSFTEGDVHAVIAGSSQLADIRRQALLHASSSSQLRLGEVDELDDEDDDTHSRLPLKVLEGVGSDQHRGGGTSSGYLCSGPTISMKASIARFDRLFKLHKQRFRSTSTLSRRNALATEIVFELTGMVSQYGLLQLSNTSTPLMLQFASFLRSMRTAKRFPECDSLCGLMADQLREGVNEPEKEAGWQLLTSYTSYHAWAMESEGILDPSAYASRVTSGGLCEGDLTRYQPEEDLTSLEALASRLEAPPLLVVTNPIDGDGTTTAPLATLVWAADDHKSQPPATTSTPPPPRLKHHLPPPILFTLADEAGRLGRECEGAKKLVQELAVYCARRFVYTSRRVGARSNIYATVADSFPVMEWSNEEIRWWQLYHPGVIGHPHGSPWVTTAASAAPSAATESDDDHQRQQQHLQNARHASWAVQRNASLLLRLSTRIVTSLAKYHILGDLADFQYSVLRATFSKGNRSPFAPPPGQGSAAASNGQRRGGAYNSGGSSGSASTQQHYSPMLRGLQQRKTASKMRMTRLTDPASVEENLLETFLIQSQQLIVKMLLFGDLVSVRDAATWFPFPSSSSSTLPSAGGAAEAGGGESAAAVTSGTKKSSTEHVMFAKCIRDIATKATLDALTQLCSELQPSIVRKAVSPTLSIFLCVPSASSLSVARGGGAGGASVKMNKDSHHHHHHVLMQCPTFYEFASLGSLADFIPKIVEYSGMNFTATVASVLDARLNEQPQCPMGPVLRIVSTITNATWRRSQMLVSLLYRLCGVIVDRVETQATSTTTSSSASSSASSSSTNKKLRRGGGGVVNESAFASPFLVSEEDLIVFIATISRADLRLPKDLVVQTAQHFFRSRKDIFGEPPVPNKSNPLASGAAGNGSPIAAFPQRPAAAVTTPPVNNHVDDDDEIASAPNPPTPTEAAAEGDDDNNKHVDPLSSESVLRHEGARSLVAADKEGYKQFMDYSMRDQLSASHRAAIHALNFNVEQLMMLIMAYAARLRVPMAERMEAQDLIRDATQDRRNRLAQSLLNLPNVVRSNKDDQDGFNGRRKGRKEATGLFHGGLHRSAPSLANATTAELLASIPSSGTNEVAAVDSDPFALRIAKPDHFGVVMLHHQFALRKLLHAAARKTGVVQAPHTLADIVEALYEAEELGEDDMNPSSGATSASSSSVVKKPLDGMLQGTFRVLNEWALLRVEDAGCDGVEDRNQFVTPSGRLFGDIALRSLKRRKKERMQTLLISARNDKTSAGGRGGRQWRVTAKSKMTV